jgi:hypothetical protein
MMSTDTRFDVDYERREPAGEGRSWWATCMIGCLVMLGVALLVIALAAFWVSRHWRGWVSNVASEGIKQAIDASDLPVQEKGEIKDQVERVADAFRENRLSKAEWQSLMEKLFESPLTTSLVVAAVETKYFDKSGLSDEEKVQGRQTLQRFVRGAIDDKIKRDARDAALKHIADRRANGDWRLRDQVTDDELRAFLEAAKAQADEAGIPEQPESIDPSEEFKRIIDEAMGEAG